MIDLEVVPHGQRRRMVLDGAAPGAGGLALNADVLRGASGGPVLGVVAGIHGDEHAGVAALTHLTHWLDASAIVGTLIVVPIANPPAAWAGSRLIPGESSDLNRSFDDTRERTPVAGAIADLLLKVMRQTDFLYAMHSWSAGYSCVPYVEHQTGINTGDASRSAAESIGLGFVEPMEPRPGRLLTAAWQAGIPALEGEVGGLGATSIRVRRTYERTVLRLLAHLGMSRHRSEVKRRPIAIRRYDISSPRNGFLSLRVPLGARVAPDDVIGEVRDPASDVRRVLRSPVGGWLAIRRETATVGADTLVASIFAPLTGDSR